METPAMIDEQWRGYDPRAAVPMFVLASLLSGLLLAGRFYFNDFTDAWVTYLVVLVIWPALLFVAVYRSVTYTYRITDRALLVDRGFLHRPVPPLPYREIAKVEQGGNWFYPLLGIGWVRVTTVDGRSLRMPALRNPAEFAGLLRARMPHGS